MHKSQGRNNNNNNTHKEFVTSRKNTNPTVMYCNESDLEEHPDKALQLKEEKKNKDGWNEEKKTEIMLEMEKHQTKEKPWWQAIQNKMNYVKNRELWI